MDMSQLKLLVTNDSVPIYLQLKYQLIHLISSGKLPEGYKLPPVRTLAKELGINHGTVVQAYNALQTEGLIQGEPGRGTFVLPIDHSDTKDYALRQQALHKSLEKTIRYAYALGFNTQELQQALNAHVGTIAIERNAAFIGYTPHSAQKFAKNLDAYLKNHNLRTTPLTIDQLENGDTTKLLETVYYVFTFAGLNYRVEDALENQNTPYKIIGITAQVTTRTLRALASLPSQLKPTLLTEERYLHSALNLIQQHSPISLKTIHTLHEYQTPDAINALKKAELVIFTGGFKPALDDLNIQSEQCLELEFDVGEDSLLKLQQTLPAVPCV